MAKSSIIENSSSKSSSKIDKINYKEIEELREENYVLRAAIKALTSEKKEQGKNYDSDIAELREITDSLKIAVTQQQQEMNVLKMKIKECGEEYKKLYLDKMKLERRLSKEKSDRVAKEVSQPVTRINADQYLDFNLPSIPPFPLPK